MQPGQRVVPADVERRAQLVSGRMEEVKDDLGRVIEVRREDSAYLQREGV